MKKKIDTESLIIWLDNQHYIIPDDIESETDEKRYEWELSRNRFIDKMINVLKYEDIEWLVSDLK